MIRDAIVKDVIQWRRQLHQIPELGNDLPQTTAYVRSILDQHEIAYQLFVNDNAIVATIEGKSPGATVGLRADMDGLLIQEATGLEFASTNGRMHACGHDGHTAMALGAAVYFKYHNDFAGTVKILFQPGEESPGGAKPMIDEGALEGIEAIFGLHHGNFEPEIPKDSFGIRPGPLMAAPDTFQITIIGKGGHGGIPNKAVDPIIVGTHLVQAFQTLVSRETSPTDPVVISVTQFVSGTTHNIIPNEAILTGTVRTVNHDTRELIPMRMQQLAHSISDAFRAEVAFDYTFTYPPLIKHPEATGMAMDSAAKVVGEDRVVLMDAPMMAAEDFAYYLERIPGCLIHFSNPQEVDGMMYPLHHPKFTIDEDLLEVGLNYLIQVALDYLDTKKTG